MLVLVVDDQRSTLKTTALALQAQGHAAETAQSSRVALQLLRSKPVQAAFIDLHLQSEDEGLLLMEKLRQVRPDLPVIIFTNHVEVRSAIRAMRRGAFDYLAKPFVREQLAQVMADLQRHLAGHRPTTAAGEPAERDGGGEPPVLDLTGEDEKLREAHEMAYRAATSEASILLLGPSGTGKTVLARIIHQKSARAQGPFTLIHCPSLSPELLESELFGHVRGAFTGATEDTWGKVATAEGGTLFLDEIGEIPGRVQAKLLRLLQEREYERLGEAVTRKASLRVLAATNRDLHAEVARGRFREDLFYRLNVVCVKLPPLCERPGSLLPCAETFLRHFAAQSGREGLFFSPEARAHLLAYHWPGNLRELRNVIERAVILGKSPCIEPADLPEEIARAAAPPHPRPGHNVSLEQLEEEHIRQILDRVDRLEDAARILGIDTATLYRKRRRLGLLERSRPRGR